jgi:hypothetical protein
MRALVGKPAAKDVWQTPTTAFFQTIPDVFSGESFGALRTVPAIPYWISHVET